MPFPVLGVAVPKRGNDFTTWLAQASLAAAGWRIEGNFPNVKKLVIIVAPHTSNWDFFIGVGAIFALRIRVKFLMKHGLFRWPLGMLMSWLGGIAVDRTQPHGVVAKVAEDFQRAESLALAITPEGTRRRGVRWKEGFYHIARAAAVPIAPVRFDYRERLIEIGPALTPTGDVEDEIARLKKFCGAAAG